MGPLFFLRGSYVLFVFLVFATTFVCAAGASDNCEDELLYPDSPRSTVIDDYHGFQSSDPYRWLENVNSEKSNIWKAAQEQLTDQYLNRIPERKKLHERVQELLDLDLERSSVSIGSYRFSLKKPKGSEYESIYYEVLGVSDSSHVLIDPLEFSSDGSVRIHSFVVSPNGRYLAYGLSESGSDWITWRIRNVETHKDLPEVIRWTKFVDVAWTANSQGFYYSRFPSPKKDRELTEVNHYNRLYYHTLATPQSTDSLVYESPENPEWVFCPEVVGHGRYLLITIRRDADRKNLIFYKELSEDGEKKGIIPLVADFRGEYFIYSVEGTIFRFRTTSHAPKGRLVSFDISHSTPREWETFPEQKDILVGVVSVADKLVLQFQSQGVSRLKIFGQDQTFISNIPLPSFGTVSDLKADDEQKGVTFLFSNVIYPPVAFHHDFVTNETTGSPQVFYNFDFEDYEIRLTHYKSFDGENIPLTLVLKKNLVLSGDHPTAIVAYGGFGLSVEADFDLRYLPFLERGGILAFPHLRGGGEQGTNWHEASKKKRRQVSINDLAAAAEHLIREKYTNPKKLASMGSSYGASLVTITALQRPELFGAVIADSGPHDLLRYHHFTIGGHWRCELGCSSDRDEFQILLKTSPLHSVKAGVVFPAFLFGTGDHDDRVPPFHSYKMVATLQREQIGPRPILLRVEPHSGHHIYLSRKSYVSWVADRWAFLLKSLGESLRE